MMDVAALQMVQRLQAAQVTGRSEKVKEEFMAIFYKELLKQTFKAPKDEGNSIMGAFSSDLLVEKLALELARSGSFSFDSIAGAGGMGIR